VFGFAKKLLEKKYRPGPFLDVLLGAAWEQKKRLVFVLISGIIGAFFEGLTFAVLAVALELLASGSSLSPDRLSSIGMGWLASWSQGKQFVLLVVCVVLCQIAKSVFQVANTQISTLLAAQAAQSVQQKTLGVILDMPFGQASSYKVGELTNFVVVPGEALSNALIQGLAWFSNLLVVVAYVFVLCTISPVLFLSSLILFGAVIYIQKLVGRRIGLLSYQLGLQQGDLSRKMVESIGALRLVHAFNQHKMIREQVGRLQDDFIKTMRDLNQRLAILGPAAESLLLMGLGAFLLVGFFLFQENRTNLLPDLLTFIAVLNRLSGRVSQIGVIWSNFANQISRASIIKDLLVHGALARKTSGSIHFESLQSNIRFVDVSLRYSSREDFALRNVSFEIPVGTNLALVGPSGGGKSSIADLMLALYEPTSGGVFFDGVESREIEPGSLRARLGVVSQDTILFNATVEENLRFANPFASEEEIFQALKGADACDFIGAMPQGVKTIVGERGFMLSGGQRQRIAIARALLRKPQILILDEATSALDTQAEQAVQKTIDTLGKGITRLTIAHRLSTVRNADRICVLDKGEIIESGRHEELIGMNGIYASLWRKQIGEDAPKGMARDGEVERTKNAKL
jgi:subfamily B ATP-binding cassette protein MsbA